MLLGIADLRRGLQLDVACGRGWSFGVFITGIHLASKQEPVIHEARLHHSAEGLVGVNNPSWVG